jgi:pilus assembly protein Flp/PilA
MNHLIQKAKDFVRNEDGATAIEYGLLAALISVVIIVAVTAIGKSLGESFTYISEQLTAAKK